MAAPPAPHTRAHPRFNPERHAYERRWWILAVLCLSLLVIVLDNTILNVAIPTIVRDLDATNSQLQWMVDSYTLVFAGLLLTAGSLGDRFGRRGAMQIGLVLFGLGSLASALASSADQLIGTRAFMGIGGALIMPATLSIITNVFPPRERGKAIGIWAGTAGLAGVLGPIIGGFLVEHFYWGSIFLVNIPIVVIGLLAGVFLIPTSKDPAAPRLDPVGAVLSIVGLTALLYGIIEAPQEGWSSTVIIGSIALGLLIIGSFLLWERRIDHPMLDVRFFRDPRFTAASGAIMLAFFAMFGSMFVVTQYLQFVLGYSPLETGIRFLPVAIILMFVAPMSARFAAAIGTKLVVGGGLSLVTIGLLLFTRLPVDAAYPDVVWRFCVLAIGVALTMAPATASIMNSLPLGKAGVGSAVNDTTRQVGGALGVAIVGSVLTSVYAAKMSDFLAGKPLPAALKAEMEESLGVALAARDRVAGLADAAKSAFVDGMHLGMAVAAVVALAGAIIAFAWLPARATHELESDTSDRSRPIGRLEQEDLVVAEVDLE